MASLAADGDWVSYRGYRPYQFRRRPSSSANLDRILSIPISAREAVLAAEWQGYPSEQHQSERIVLRATAAKRHASNSRASGVISGRR
jgi:bifunctional DNase/RNase